MKIVQCVSVDDPWRLHIWSPVPPTRMNKRPEPCTRFRVVALHNAVSLNRLWSPRYTHSAVSCVPLHFPCVSPQRARERKRLLPRCSHSCQPLSRYTPLAIHFFQMYPHSLGYSETILGVELEIAIVHETAFSTKYQNHRLPAGCRFLKRCASKATNCDD